MPLPPSANPHQKGGVQPSADPNDFPAFSKMDSKTYIKRKGNLLLPLHKAAKELSINWNDIKFSQKRINEIVDMVQRREVYFHVYHKIAMGELNEACLNSFWIMKFCPFHYIQDPGYNLNLVFALALFTRAVNWTAQQMGNRPPSFTTEVVTDLIHAFTYRDLSKEALMSLAKSLTG
jgi:hypothetical protein